MLVYYLMFQSERVSLRKTLNLLLTGDWLSVILTKSHQAVTMICLKKIQKSY